MLRRPFARAFQRVGVEVTRYIKGWRRLVNLLLCRCYFDILSTQTFVANMRTTTTQVTAGLLLASTVHAHPKPQSKGCQLSIPRTAANASIPHSNSFASFSFEPAFWVEFFGNASEPNALTFNLIDLIVKHGGRPIIRPGGITMDSMVSYQEPKHDKSGLTLLDL